MTRPAEWIAAKRDGRELAATEIADIVRAVVDGSISDGQLGALLMAGLLQGSTREETVAWTMAMRDSGRILERAVGPSLDKHSTGGVGDKISLVLAPLVAACGGRVPMISGRGLGHTGGTIDKLESIPGLRTDLAIDEFEATIDSVGFAMASAGPWLAPADRRIYALRDITATVECVPWITASILSKKLAEGLDGLVLDVKCGRGAFMKDLASARVLAQSLVEVAQALGCATEALVTDMDVPLGNAIGNALEVLEAIECLHGRGPVDVRRLTLDLAASMLVSGGIDEDRSAARSRAATALDDGSALDRFRRFVEVQGGDPRVVLEPTRVLPSTSVVQDVIADNAGTVVDLDPMMLAQAALSRGAGRARAHDVLDPAAGIVIERHVGATVRRGDVLARVYGTLRQGEQPADLARAWTIDARSGPASESVGGTAGRQLVLEHIA
ncbi:MAG: thymidine phosphorylase [Planctomycetes bacterium]|nr:thymidine phosphorylase [Planctomycetota bacterium]